MIVLCNVISHVVFKFWYWRRTYNIIIYYILIKLIKFYYAYQQNKHTSSRITPFAEFYYSAASAPIYTQILDIYRYMSFERKSLVLKQNPLNLSRDVAIFKSICWILWQENFPTKHCTRAKGVGVYNINSTKPN